MKKRAGLLLAALGVVLVASVRAQQTPAPTPPPATTPPPDALPTPAPTAAPLPPGAGAAEGTALPEDAPPLTPTPRGRGYDEPPLRIRATPNVPIAVLPQENPFGGVVDAPAALPPKPAFAKEALQSALFTEIRVDANGKPLVVRRVRDPIPSLGAETQRDLARWSFEPARRGAQQVEAWAALRLDLQVAIEPPRIDQATLVPISPATPLPAPLQWGTDEAWYQGLAQSPAPADGSVPAAQLDVAPTPKRTPFPDSFKGPFTGRLWVRVAASGRIDRVVPIAASDPILVPYLRKAVAGWTARPARKGTEAVESWNELTLAGQVSYSVEIRQITQLRRSLPAS